MRGRGWSRLPTKLKEPRYRDDLNGSDHGWKVVSGPATRSKCPGPPSIPDVEGERLSEKRCGFGKFFPRKRGATMQCVAFDGLRSL